MSNLALFNDALFEYLGRYNFRRPHQGLDYKTPPKQLAFALICPICHSTVQPIYLGLDSDTIERISSIIIESVRQTDD